MVQKDHSPKEPGEPPQLGDAWWKAALSEGDDGFICAEFQENSLPSSDDEKGNKKLKKEKPEGSVKDE